MPDGNLGSQANHNDPANEVAAEGKNAIDPGFLDRVRNNNMNARDRLRLAFYVTLGATIPGLAGCDKDTQAAEPAVSVVQEDDNITMVSTTGGNNENETEPTIKMSADGRIAFADPWHARGANSTNLSLEGTKWEANAHAFLDTFNGRGGEAEKAWNQLLADENDLDAKDRTFLAEFIAFRTDIKKEVPEGLPEHGVPYKDGVAMKYVFKIAEDQPGVPDSMKAKWFSIERTGLGHEKGNPFGIMASKQIVPDLQKAKVVYEYVRTTNAIVDKDTTTEQDIAQAESLRKVADLARKKE